MEYAMPLVDDLLTDMEAYLWFCSLDAASGFWAVMMTERAREVSAFVCALGHFEWRRMPFGLKKRANDLSTNDGQRFVGEGGPNFRNACDRPKKTPNVKTGVTEHSTRPRSKFEADRASASTMDPVSRLVNSQIGDMFANGELDESSLVPVFDRRSFVDDICFGSESFDGCLATLDRLLQRFTECRISVSFTKSIFVQPRVDFLSHEVIPEGLRADAKKAKKIKRVTEFSFPTTKKGMQSFLVYAATLYQLKEEDFVPGGDMSAARQSFAMLQQKIGDAPILRHFDRGKQIYVTLFANEWALSSTLMQEHEGKIHPVRFCGRVLKDAEMNYHPAEKEVLALLLLLKTCYTQLAGKTIHVYTRFSTLGWVHTSKSLFGRTAQFAVLLSSWHLIVTRVKEKDCALVIDGDTTFEMIAYRPAGPSAPVRTPTEISSGVCGILRWIAKPEKYGGYGGCSWTLWRLPEWTIVTAASAYLEATTVNKAEYSGMNRGVQAALDHGATELVIVGNSRLAIQQSLGETFWEVCRVLNPPPTLCEST
ncbi:LOW QUALITY PROTEIN: hypothetical protein PHMEG_00027147 [Phytophthora megakarya]|uniref:Reverse transcriptase RNase H-like domain-containing protein n=1 Tax=Phytophthora megakarya TaxID=4795 RepID=A0A225V913_9STRA|nr:LOW QUALITY PROTEIN: hypothetical protein PHMEG_00027147 [Phytophthora megakarya]